jgi:hypothetical protein
VSVHEPPQFTPAQVLEAARRAEAEGRNELAQKFYLHLADNYAGSSEAAAAQTALSRLSMGAVPGGVAMHSGQPNGNGQRGPTMARQVPAFEAGPYLDPPSLGAPMPGVGYSTAGSPPLGNPFETPRGPEPGFGQWQQPYPPAPMDAPTAVQDRPQEAGPVELSTQVQDYRTGRVLARCCAWLGGLAVIAGLVLLALLAFGPRGLPLVSSLGIWQAGMALIGGLGLMLLGQSVRALFDQANATRDMAAVLRAEAEARHGVMPPRRKRRR